MSANRQFIDYKNDEDYLYARELFQNKHYEDALEVFQKIAHTNFNNERAKHNIAKCYSKLMNFDEAIKTLDSIKPTKNEMTNFSTHISYIKCYMKMLKYSKHMTIKEKDYADKIQYHIDLIPSHMKNDFYFQRLLASYYYQTEKYEKCLEIVSNKNITSLESMIDHKMIELRAYEKIDLEKAEICKKQLYDLLAQAEDSAVRTSGYKVLSGYADWQKYIEYENTQSIDLSNRDNDPLMVAYVAHKTGNIELAQQAYDIIVPEFKGKRKYDWAARLQYAFFLIHNDYPEESLPFLFQIIDVDDTCPDEDKPTLHFLERAYNFIVIAYDFMNKPDMTLKYGKMIAELFPDSESDMSSYAKFVAEDKREKIYANNFTKNKYRFYDSHQLPKPLEPNVSLLEETKTKPDSQANLQQPNTPIVQTQPKPNAPIAQAQPKRTMTVLARPNQKTTPLSSVNVWQNSNRVREIAQGNVENKPRGYKRP